VDKHILAAALRLNKSVSLLRVEPLHSACRHNRLRIGLASCAHILARRAIGIARPELTGSLASREPRSGNLIIMTAPPPRRQRNIFSLAPPLHPQLARWYAARGHRQSRSISADTERGTKLHLRIGRTINLNVDGAALGFRSCPVIRFSFRHFPISFLVQSQNERWKCRNGLDS